MKTLVIYAFHELNLNVEFFVQRGPFEHPDIDFYYCLNHPTLPFAPPIGTVVRRENRNFDFGAWGHILLTNDRYTQYDRYILLNSSVRGPFLPVWATGSNWVDLFTSRITDDLKLFGTSVSYHPDLGNHVQSMILALDRVGMDIGIAHGIFAVDGPTLDMNTTVYGREIGLSQAILKAGYNIGCMLKAFDGVDFRRCAGQTDGFMQDRLYCGTEIHPYEVIFPKTPTKRLCVSACIQTINRCANWELSSKVRTCKWDGLQYALYHADIHGAGLKKSEDTWRHYRSVGWLEGRGFNYNPRYYKVDLNPGRTSGLFNQMYSLINAILIGHYTQREIIVYDFYPDYNVDRRIPLGQIIDLERLNLLLVDLNLNTYVNDAHRLVPEVKWIVDTCRPSHYINPTKEPYRQHGAYEVLRRLREETHWLLDLRDTFEDNFFMRNPDTAVCDRFKQILTNLPFARPFQEEVRRVQTELELVPGAYKVVHLRLEDDMLFGSQHAMELYSKYREWLARLVTSEDAIFVATHLTKAPYTMNFVVDELKVVYPRLRLRTALPETFPFQGRDIQAIIDYMVCLDGDVCLGRSMATFSQGISYVYDATFKPYFDVDTSVCTVSTPEFDIFGYTVGYGAVGIGGDLGFDERGMTRVSIPDLKPEQHTISAHAPATITLRLHRAMMICGHSHCTAHGNPRMTFYCDGNKIGECVKAHTRTDVIRLEAGFHKLEVTTSVLSYSHSVWILE